MNELSLFCELALFINQELYDAKKISLEIYRKTEEKIIKKQRKL